MNYRKFGIIITSSLLCAIIVPSGIRAYNVMNSYTPTEAIEETREVTINKPIIEPIIQDSKIEESSTKEKIEEYLKRVDGYSEEVKSEENVKNKTSLTTKKSDKVVKNEGLEFQTRYNSLVSELLTLAETYQNVPYVWGGTSKTNGMDCSGFLQHLYKQIGYELPRVSKDQSKVGKLVSRKELKPGDLLFFDTRNPRDENDIKTPTTEMEYANAISKGFKPNVISHAGMYVGNNMMIHASSGHGYITYESIDKEYYKVRFINARRIIKDERVG